ncbi:MAG: type IV pilus biogenesis protein EbsA [Microcystaceae cyanobacterium]
MLNINQLAPAGKGDVLVYLPYYSNKDKQKILPVALTLYNSGRLEGQRRIEGGTGISFVASWFISKLPSELTRCRLQFESQAELSYEITILNSEFIDYLIELILIARETTIPDFPQSFYRRLLRFDELQPSTTNTAT